LFDTNQIQQLCVLLSLEKDNAKAREIACVIRDMLSCNAEETRSKLEFIAKHCPELEFGVDPIEPAA
jgi:hypothetical protein